MNGNTFTLDALMRTGHVGRYHTLQATMLRQQTTAEHAYGVALILVWLLGDHAGGQLLQAALLHDAGEYWVGDIPSPTKRHFDAEFGTKLDHLEWSALEKATGVRFPTLSPEEGALLHLADVLEGCVHCTKEHSMGNRTHLGVWMRYAKYMEKALREAPISDEHRTRLTCALNHYHPERRAT